MEVAMLRAVVGFCLLMGCSHGPGPRPSSPPPEQAPPADDVPADTAPAIDDVPADSAPPLQDQPINDACATDADCALGVYPRIGTSCCAYRCGYDVVTKSRAAARDRDYKERCWQVQCQPHDCPQSRTLYPVCRDSRCVDHGHPGVPMPGESR